MSEKRYEVYGDRTVWMRHSDDSLRCVANTSCDFINTQSATIARLEAENAELRALIKRRPPNTCCNLEMIADDGQWNSFGEVTEQAKLDAKMLLEIIQGEEVSDAAEVRQCEPLTEEFMKAANIEAETPITINNPSFFNREGTL